MNFATVIAAACALGSLAVGTAAAVNSWIKDRVSREKRLTQLTDTADHAASNQAQIAHQGELIERLTIVMIGRPDEPGMPGVDGFVQTQRAINDHVHEDLEDLKDKVSSRGRRRHSS